jgi:hypothetical protein
MKHIMKVYVKLGFIRWKSTDEPIPAVLAGTPDELNTNSVLDGVLTLTPGKLYEIMKSANERGLKPVLELTIAEDQKPGLPEKKKDKDQTELVLDRYPGPADPPAEELAPEGETPPPDEEKPVDKKPIVR